MKLGLQEGGMNWLTEFTFTYGLQQVDKPAEFDDGARRARQLLPVGVHRWCAGDLRVGNA